MDIYLGEEGLNQTWQEDFPKTMKCHKCGGEARIMFVGCEGDEEKYIASLHKTTGKKGGLWLHDCCCVGLYLCPFCFEPNALINQA